MNDSSVCPDARVLKDVLDGRASEGETRRVEEHVRQCAGCRGNLQALRAAEATGAIEMRTLDIDASPLTREVTAADEVPGVGDYPFLAPPQEPDELGRLGPYRVLRVLGAGGMGVVFEAEDPKLQRRVALKVMRPSGAGQMVFRERFLREARASAKLEHDNVIAIYQVDEDRNVLYLAMPLLRGETLEERLQRERAGGVDSPLPLPEVLRIGREIAEGLDAAHSHGLIHRDIKPSNVWLEAGRGRVKILDFGLARIANGGGQLTREGLVLGTPAYMAPEQARGLPLDGRCDLFSLGCILYRMCTGRNPFVAATPYGLLLAVTTVNPRPPRDLSPDLPPELADLVMEMLAKNPAGRPASAREVADRLAVLEHAGQATEALAAVPPKPVHRRRWSLLGLAAFLVVLGGLAAAAWRFGPQLSQMFSGAPAATGARPDDPDKPPPDDAAANPAATVGVLLVEAEDPQVEVIVRQNGVVVVPATKRRQLELKPGVYDVELAEGGRGAQLTATHFTVEAGGVATVQVQTAAAAAKAGDPLSLLTLVGRPAPLPRVRSWTLETRGHRGPVLDAACSPKAPLLATAGADGAVRLWDLESGKLSRVFPCHDHAVRAVAWSPDGKAVASVSADGRMDLRNADTGKLLLSQHAGGSRALAWSPDGVHLAVADLEKKIHIWDAETGKHYRTLEGRDAVYGVAWSPDGKILASAGADGVWLWDAEKGKDPRVLGDARGEVVALAWSPDGKLLAVGRPDLTVQVWSVGAPDKLAQTLSTSPAPDKVHPAGVLGLAWAPRGFTLATIHGGGAQLWKPDSNKPTRTIPATGTVVSWSADGNRLATAGDEDEGVRIWNLASPVNPPPATSLPGYKLERIREEKWSPEGKQVALCGVDTVWLVKAATGRPVHGLHGPTRDVTALAWSPGGGRIAAAGGWDRKVYVWDALSGKTVNIYTSPHPDCEITALAWSPDGKTLAVGVDRPVEVPLWDVDGGAAAVVLKGQHTAAVNALLWIDDKTVLTGSADDTGIFWNAETGKPGRVLHPSRLSLGRPVTALAPAPDGTAFAVGLGRTLDRAARLYHINSELPYQDLRGPGVAGGDLLWLPDGKTLAGRGADGSLRFWDAESGQLTRTLPPRPGSEYLLPERGVGASGSASFSVRYWGLDDFRLETTIVLVRQSDSFYWLTVSSDGHYTTPPAFEAELVYVVQTDAGLQTLTPKDFSAVYSWKNDPSRIALPIAR